MKHSRSSRTGQRISETAATLRRQQERKNQQNPRKPGRNTIKWALPVKKILALSGVTNIYICKSFIINGL